MSNVWGRNIKLSIFGESHGISIGIVLSGLPPGVVINMDDIAFEMARRAPGKTEFSTPRRENDKIEIISGLFEGKTTGAPLCVIIPNENTKSGDYEPNFLRPGHADFPALIKYAGFTDYRGGGHFSGRLTAPLVFAGAIAKQILKNSSITIGGRIKQISSISDASIDTDLILKTSKKQFPVYDDVAADKMKQAILKAKEEGDSVGGIIQCAAVGVPAGWGEPFFDSLESVIASMMFSIPSVKGIEFGAGFALSEMKGSESNDPLYMSETGIKIKTNNNGGINGGISNGQAIEFNVIIKSTPSISKEQTTVNIQKNETVIKKFGGRHDPCIVPRAVPVIEAGLALCLLDFWKEESGINTNFLLKCY